MKIFSTTTLILLFSLSVFAQKNTFWNDITETQLNPEVAGKQQIFPLKKRTLSLDLDGMKKVLANAPMEFTAESKTNRVSLEMPLPDGSMETFEVWETKQFQDELAAKYPNIRSFLGQNKTTGSIISLGYGTLGFHASIMTLGATYYIDPFALGQEEVYMVYNVKDDLDNWGSTQKLACGYTADDAAGDFSEGLTVQQSVSNRVQGVEQNLREFIIVLSCTGEFARNRGGDVPGVLSTFGTVLSRLNQIYQTEVAVKMVLHNEVEKVIFLNGDTDPYPIADNGGELLSINNAVVNARINVETYDIGNCLTNRCTDVGGVASGTNACRNGRKAGGITCNGNGTGLNISTLAHEMGHQNSVSHSWDNCPGSEGQRASQSSFEPGSGTTIMSYSGACGSQNIGSDDDYFSNGSIEQFINYTHTVVAGCGTTIPSGNTKPEIQWDYVNGFTIPASTPFELMAEATDEDGDPLMYTWEQHDLRAIATFIGMPDENAPMWRSYSPSATGFYRSFPLLPYVLNPGQANIPVVEQSADYSREFNFTLTVRDNNPAAGATVWEQVTFDVDGTKGPFGMISQAEIGAEWTVGQEVEIIWDPAGTADAPVNCEAIDLYLSTGNAIDFDKLILESTPNDGYEKIFVPDAVSTGARLKIKCADNIFYNVNARRFPIVEATEPSFTAKVSPTYHYACLPDNTVFEIETGSVLNFDSVLTVELAGSLPTGITANFDKTQLAPGESAQLSLDMTNNLGSGFTTLEVIIFGENTDTVKREILLEYFRNDFSDIKTTGPINGVAGVEELPTLTWTDSPDAQSYDLQVATNPAFGPDDLVVNETGLTSTSYAFNDLLVENTPYYWRIRPANQCGKGDFLATANFHTVSKKCQSLIGLEGDIQRIPIPGSGLPTILSSVSILEPGTINDVNVLNIKGSYEPLKSIRISLVSPDSTKAILFERRCNGSVFNFGFDDAVTNRDPCPATDGRIRGPQDKLSIFNGTELTGSWGLEVEVVEPGVGGGGSLEEWTLEFCADLALEAPTLIINDTLPVRFGLGENISNGFLETIDDIDAPWGINYTVVTLPKYGTITKDGEPVKIGDEFTQKVINDKRLWYVHDGVSQETNDEFTFTVRDTEGGWLATPQFNFKLDASSVGIDDIDQDLQENITLFPNPANDVLNIQIDRIINEAVNITFFNAQGKIVKSLDIENPDAIMKIDIASLTDGFYFLSFTTERGKATKSLMVKK